MSISDDVRARALEFIIGAQKVPKIEIVEYKPTLNSVALANIICKPSEGLYRLPYLCPAGVPTIGYGATFYEDGTRVALRDPIISVARAEELLAFHMSKVFLPAVNKLCPNLPTLVEAAILDFVFNLGIARLASSTLRRKLNDQDWDGACAELSKWIYSAGKPLKGIIIRRNKEIQYIRDYQNGRTE